ncbi:hypothetical protein BpHYR1_043814 [Brachionus plicatilis]|uniref:Uncharacterized protein n=1 Tax=Brachionus plicatilis TaxID=10195 RepID=A0A3M7RWU8_BRAPC|nr:hypothetical protein BpHYR1_043814 [Brachionus plicatilis]
MKKILIFRKYLKKTISLFKNICTTLKKNNQDLPKSEVVRQSKLLEFLRVIERPKIVRTLKTKFAFSEKETKADKRSCNDCPDRLNIMHGHRENNNKNNINVLQKIIKNKLESSLI